MDVTSILKAMLVTYNILRGMTDIICILQDGQTALYYASSRGHLEIVTVLVNNGCDLEIANIVSHK